MKSLPWLLGLSLFACAEGFTKEEPGSSGGATSTSGGASSGSGGAIREGGRGGTSNGGTSDGGTSGGSTNGGSNTTGGKASGGAKSSGGAGGSPNSGGARPAGGSNSGGNNASGGSNSGGVDATGGSDATGGAPEGGAGGMGPEIPTTDGLVLWLRADQGVTVEGDAVTRWADQSGQAYDATPGSPDERPTLVDNGISGLPSVSFDGVDDVLNLPAGFEDFTQGVSIFSVRQATSTDKCWAVMELSNGSEVDDISFGQYKDAPLYEVYTDVLNTGKIELGTPQMVSAVHRTTLSADIRVNLTNAGSGTVALPAVVERAQNFIGHTLYGDCMPFPGMIAELIVYRRAVTSDERTAIEAYLRERWSCCTK